MESFFGKIIIIINIIIIIIIITPNIFLAHTPAGAESDLNAAAAAPRSDPEEIAQT